MDFQVDPLENIKDFGKDLKVKESGDTGDDLSQPSLGVLTLHNGTYSSATFSKQEEDVQFQLKRTRSSSSYSVATDMSHLDANVDRWMTGTTSTTTATSAEIGVQRSRLPVIQRSTDMSSFNVAGVWCVVALALPLFSINVPRSWLCSPSAVMNSAEMCLTNIATIIARARAHVMRLAGQQVQAARDCFAMAMDIVLVIYAFGFLLLSLYQAEIIG